MNQIYFDNAATTKPLDEILSTYEKVAKEYYGNASSIHFLGAEAFNLLNKASEQILNNFSLNGYEVIFTSGATEAINLAIKGYCLMHQNRGKHIITSVYEHPSVLESIKQLEENFGFIVTYLDIDSDGHIDYEQLKNSITKETILVAIMAVNNEIGSINDARKIKELIKDKNKIVFFMDTTQAIGKIKLDYSLLDMFVVAGHKIHGLKGTGCLIKKRSIDLLPLNSGGGQQENLRSGTIDLPGAISLSRAIRLINQDLDNNFKKVVLLRDSLLSYLEDNKDYFEINSSYENPYIINFSSKYHKASVIVEALSRRGIYVSSISACHSKKEKFSYVVDALKKDKKIAKNTIRVSFSYDNTLKEVEVLKEELHKIIGDIRDND